MTKDLLSALQIPATFPEKQARAGAVARLRALGLLGRCGKCGGRGTYWIRGSNSVCYACDGKGVIVPAATQEFLQEVRRRVAGGGLAEYLKDFERRLGARQTEREALERQRATEAAAAEKMSAYASAIEDLLRPIREVRKHIRSNRLRGPRADAALELFAKAVDVSEAATATISKLTAGKMSESEALRSMAGVIEAAKSIRRRTEEYEDWRG